MLRMRVIELESRLNASHAAQATHAHNRLAPYATPVSLDGGENGTAAVQAAAYEMVREAPWPNVQNRFPAIAFLDSETFKYGG